MNKEKPVFKDYKEKQKYYKEKANEKTIVYETKGLNRTPYRKYKDRKVERKVAHD
jgi:hypothetical protein